MILPSFHWAGKPRHWDDQQLLKALGLQWWLEK